MRTTLENALRETGVLVLDGSMATALEEMGCDLNDALWTAKVLAAHPERIRDVHRNYLRAGADCGITASYQASIPGLMKQGFTLAEAEALIARSVTLFLEAREDWWNAEGRAARRAYPLCLAGVGPYGAYLADGSEYRGRYGVSDETLRQFHARRAELLWNAGADALLFETQPSLREALIEADIAEALGADYWISFSCRDEKHINEGDPIADCARRLSEGHSHLKAIGVNCTAPVYIRGLIAELKSATALPVAVYPNSGEQYDPATKTWHGTGEARAFGDYAAEWMRAGARIVGGCCCTVCGHIRQVAHARADYARRGVQG